MKLYLVQHAEARKEEEDPQRSLTEKGRRDIEKTSAHIAKHIQVKTIFHSGKTRAKQTAEVLSKYLNPSDGIKEIDGLDPLSDPSIWVNRLIEIKDDIMIVGHLPHLGKLSALLLCGDSTKKVVDFQMSGVVCLIRDEGGSWSIQLAVIPQMLA